MFCDNLFLFLPQFCFPSFLPLHLESSGGWTGTNGCEVLINSWCVEIRHFITASKSHWVKVWRPFLTWGVHRDSLWLSFCLLPRIVDLLIQNGLFYLFYCKCYFVLSLILLSLPRSTDFENSSMLLSSRHAADKYLPVYDLQMLWLVGKLIQVFLCGIYFHQNVLTFLWIYQNTKTNVILFVFFFCYFIIIVLFFCYWWNDRIKHIVQWITKL